MSYHQLKIQKRVGGKVKRYTNLRTFIQECGKRSYRGNICTLENIRKLRDGSGMATVRSETGPIKGRQSGTWLLHFASYDVMKRHLKGRVESKRSGMLDGTRRKRSRR